MGTKKGKRKHSNTGAQTLESEPKRACAAGSSETASGDAPSDLTSTAVREDLKQQGEEVMHSSEDKDLKPVGATTIEHDQGSDQIHPPAISQADEEQTNQEETLVQNTSKIKYIAECFTLDICAWKNEILTTTTTTTTTNDGDQGTDLKLSVHSLNSDADNPTVSQIQDQRAPCEVETDWENKLCKAIKLDLMPEKSPLVSQDGNASMIFEDKIEKTHYGLDQTNFDVDQDHTEKLDELVSNDKVYLSPSPRQQPASIEELSTVKKQFAWDTQKKPEVNGDSKDRREECTSRENTAIFNPKDVKNVSGSYPLSHDSTRDSGTGENQQACSSLATETKSCRTQPVSDSDLAAPDKRQGRDDADNAATGMHVQDGRSDPEAGSLGEKAARTAETRDPSSQTRVREESQQHSDQPTARSSPDDGDTFEMDITESQLCQVPDYDDAAEAGPVWQQQRHDGERTLREALNTLLQINDLVSRTRGEMEKVRRTLQHGQPGATLTRNLPQLGTTLTRNLPQLGTTLTRQPTQLGTTLIRHPPQLGATLTRQPPQLGTTLTRHPSQLGRDFPCNFQR